MKKFRFMSGFIVGGLLFGSVGAYAATNSKMIEVFFNVNDIKVNKISKMPKDNQPFIYNGSTYVPLRFVADALGQPAKWVPETRTILIGDTETENEYYLGDNIKPMNYRNSFMTVFQGKIDEYNGYIVNANYFETDNVNNKYENFLIMGAGETSGVTEFPLNGQYKKFKAKFTLPDAHKGTKAIATLEIKGDDKVLWTKSIKAGDFPIDIDVDVKNFNKITLTLTSSENNGVSAGLYNARLTK